MRINEKTKKFFTIAGCTVVGLALLAVIGLQVGQAPKEADTLLPDSTVSSDVTPSVDVDLSTGEKDLVVKLNTDSTSDSGEQTTSQTDQTEQSIQPEVTKPEEPSKEQKTNPTQKPDGETVAEPPEPVKHEEVTVPTETSKQADEPQGGETKNGKIYVPGFGWIDDIGEGQGTTADDMYENGNKIGEMN